jgi:protein ImuA
MTPALRIEHLKAQVRAIETPKLRPVVSLGEDALDGALPWGGLPLACQHEIAGQPGDRGGAFGFALGMLIRLGGKAPILWCQRADAGSETGTLYAPGIAGFGLAPERLLVVRAQNTAQVLWAMEEGLRSSGLAAVVGEVDAVGFADSRRLQLAAEAGGVTALTIVPHQTAISGAVTRWSVASSGRREAGRWEWAPRWHVALTRARGGAPAAWELEWDRAQSRFSVAAGVFDRSAQPRPAQMAG